MAYKFFEKCS